MRKCPTAWRRVDGFTLVEVLVAGAILVSVLTVALGVFSSGVAGTRKADEYTHALSIAVARMAEIEGDTLVAPGAWNGVADERFEWRTRVEPVFVAQGDPQPAVALVPYQVVVQVAWQEREQRRAVELQTLRLGKPR